MWLVSLAAFAAPDPPFRFDGRAEIAPVIGWFFPDPKLAFRPAFLYGAEIDHFLGDLNPLVVVGVYAKVEGCRTEVKNGGQDVDVIYGSAGVTVGVAGLGRWLPLLRLGEGFIVADGTPGGLDIQGRVAGEVGVGLRFLATRALAVRAGIDGVLHENLLIGAGTSEIGGAFDVALVAGVSVVR